MPPAGSVAGDNEQILMLDQAIRYGSIFRQPEYSGGKALLEAGPGSEGITVFIDRKVIGVDMIFSHDLSDNLVAVRGSAAALPVRNSSFSRVVCSDMIEHLPEEDRAGAIRELVRVTGGTLFLALPCGAAAGAIDGFFLKVYTLFRIGAPEWMIEHRQMGMPDAASIRTILNGCNVRYREVRGESTVTHFFVTLLISFRVLNNLWRRVFFRKINRARMIGRCAPLAGLLPYRRLWIVDVGQ